MGMGRKSRSRRRWQAGRGPGHSVCRIVVTGRLLMPDLYVAAGRPHARFNWSSVSQLLSAPCMSPSMGQHSWVMISGSLRLSSMLNCSSQAPPCRCTRAAVYSLLALNCSSKHYEHVHLREVVNVALLVELLLSR